MGVPWGMPAIPALPLISFFLGVSASLFSVLNPPSAAGLFATQTVGMDRGALRRSARKAALTATLTMVIFALVGQIIFRFFGFTALAMRFVGGALILYRAMSMIYGDDPRERHTDQERAEASLKLPDDFAIIPFGIPLLAGPGTISTVMGLIVGLTFTEHLAVLAAIVLNGYVCYLFLRQAPRVINRLGALGTKIMNKLMGLILAAVAMQFLINGVKGLVLEIQHPVAAVSSGAAPR